MLGSWERWARRDSGCRVQRDSTTTLSAPGFCGGHSSGFGGSLSSSFEAVFGQTAGVGRAQQDLQQRSGLGRRPGRQVSESHLALFAALSSSSSSRRCCCL